MRGQAGRPRQKHGATAAEILHMPNGTPHNKQSCPQLAPTAHSSPSAGKASAPPQLPGSGPDSLLSERSLHPHEYAAVSTHLRGVTQPAKPQQYTCSLHPPGMQSAPLFPRQGSTTQHSQLLQRFEGAGACPLGRQRAAQLILEQVQLLQLG